MNRILFVRWAFAIVLGVLTSCSSSDFTIQAQLDGVPERIVIIAYNGDHGIVTERVTLEQGNSVTYHGSSEEYTLVSMWDQQGQLIAQLVAHNGDKMTVKSDGLQLPTTQVSGNEVTEQWMKFRKDNNQAYDSHDTAAIDRLIEQYIGQHPDKLLSTVLLVADYGQLDGGKRMRQLLQDIHAEVRPQRLTSTLEYLLQLQHDMPERISTLTLYRLGKGFEDLKANERATVLLFWSRNGRVKNSNWPTCLSTPIPRNGAERSVKTRQHGFTGGHQGASWTRCWEAYPLFVHLCLLSPTQQDASHILVSNFNEFTHRSIERNELYAACQGTLPQPSARADTFHRPC